MNDQDYKLLWNEAISQIRQDFEAQGNINDFMLWFRMEFARASDDKINIYVPSDFMWAQIQQRNYISIMENKLSSIAGRKIVISGYKIKSCQNIIDNSTADSQNSVPQTTQNSQISSPSSQSVPTPLSTGIENLTPKIHPQLNENFTFDTYVTGENSLFAYNVAIAASNNPGSVYNPILIYGGVGLGKTHLMQSIGNKLYADRGDSFKICYITSENFTNEFTTSIRTNTTDKFKSKYRKIDLLLLDDIHFLIDKIGVQGELFNTFEALSQHKSQMVFTCDRPITELKGIEDRLKSRFSSGICIDLQPPNYETRYAIIEKKLEILNKTLSPEVIDYLAKNIQTNVRDLEACLKKAVAYAELMGKELTLEIVSKLFKDTFVSPSSTAPITIDTIQKVVADHYNISISDLKSKKRDNKYSNPRHIAVYLSRHLTEFSLPEIGNEFGGRDHTTIMHSNSKIEDLLKTDSDLNSTIQILSKKIKEYKK